MSDLWLAALEDKHGMWLDDPITGCETKEDAKQRALKEWKVEPEEAIVIYRCTVDEVIEGK